MSSHILHVHYLCWYATLTSLKLVMHNLQVRLIASVPGYHKGANLKKWGHMKLRAILQQCIFDKMFQKSPLVYQVGPDLSWSAWESHHKSLVSRLCTENNIEVYVLYFYAQLLFVHCWISSYHHSLYFLLNINSLLLKENE